MAKVCWPYFDPEYENFSSRINPPRFTANFPKNTILVFFSTDLHKTETLKKCTAFYFNK
jgi:hypothetical protein